MYVANSTRDPTRNLLFLGQGGYRAYQSGRDDTTFVALFTYGMEVGDAPSRYSRTERERAVALKTAVHEIGHVLNIGEADEGSDEIYSGNGNDPTPERVIDKRGRTSTSLFWSVMSSGTNDDQYLPPTNETYFAFSIEELFTIDTSDTAIKDDDDE